MFFSKIGPELSKKLTKRGPSKRQFCSLALNLQCYVSSLKLLAGAPVGIMIKPEDFRFIG